MSILGVNKRAISLISRSSQISIRLRTAAWGDRSSFLLQPSNRVSKNIGTMRIRSSAATRTSAIYCLFFSSFTNTIPNNCKTQGLLSANAFLLKNNHSKVSLKTATKMSTTATNDLSSIVLDNSWPRDLSPETPENLEKSRKIERLGEDDDNRSKRPVFNGHYVLVKPTGLTNPKRIIVSDDVAYNLLKLTQEQVESDDFLQFVSGNLVLNDGAAETWATPYALSIMGSRYTNNCPYGTGVGYGKFVEAPQVVFQFGMAF